MRIRVQGGGGVIVGVYVCVTHMCMTVNPGPGGCRISVNPAVSNLRKLGSAVAGNSLGETYNPEKIIQRMRRTLNQLHGSPELLQRPSDGEHTLHPVGRQSGTHFGNWFSVNSVSHE